MKLLQATKDDVNQLFHCIEEARSYFKENKIPQWQSKQYPSIHHIFQDIEKGQSYVVKEDDQVIATAAISLEKDPNYIHIEGHWLKDENYMVVHRIAILPTWKGKQVGKLFIEYAKKKALAFGYASVRIDTHPKNQAMIRLIEKCGFTYCGIIYVEDGTPRNAYELLVSSK